MLPEAAERACELRAGEADPQTAVEILELALTLDLPDATWRWASLIRANFKNFRVEPPERIRRLLALADKVSPR